MRPYIAPRDRLVECLPQRLIDTGLTRANQLALLVGFAKAWRLCPRMLVDVSKRQMKVTVLGQPLALPMLVAPMAFQWFSPSRWQTRHSQRRRSEGHCDGLEHPLNQTVR